MTLELTFETTDEPDLKEEEGGVFERYSVKAYHQGDEVGSLTVIRLRSTTNPKHHAFSLLFLEDGSSRTYAAGLEVNSETDVSYIGAKLIEKGDEFCRERFDTKLFGIVALPTPLEDLVWGSLFGNGQTMKYSDRGIEYFTLIR